MYRLTDIIITTNEPKAELFVAHLVDAGYEAYIEFLPAGDFLVLGKRRENDSTLIERKTASDLLGSLEGKKSEAGMWEKGRIWSQLEKMKESGVVDRQVLIEGNVTRVLTAWRKKGFTKRRLWGAYRGISKWNTHIVHTKNLLETVEYLSYLIDKKEKPKAEFSLRVSANKRMSLEDKRLYLLQGLPNIGPKTSRKIRREHKTVMSFFKNIDKSNAVGPATKKEIKKILG